MEWCGTGLRNSCNVRLRSDEGNEERLEETLVFSVVASKTIDLFFYAVTCKQRFSALSDEDLASPTSSRTPLGPKLEVWPWLFITVRRHYGHREALGWPEGQFVSNSAIISADPPVPILHSKSLCNGDTDSFPFFADGYI